jgi:hypothetical protein
MIMSQRKDREKEKELRQVQLEEARKILEGKIYAKPSFLARCMRITGAKGASLMRSLGFVKYNKRSWKREVC